MNDYGPVGPYGPVAPDGPSPDEGYQPNVPRPQPSWTQIASGSFPAVDESYGAPAPNDSPAERMARLGRPFYDTPQGTPLDALGRLQNVYGSSWAPPQILDPIGNIPIAGGPLRRAAEFATTPETYLIPGSTSAGGLEALGAAAIGGPAAREAAKRLGGGETAQSVADVAGSLLAPLGAATGRGGLRAIDTYLGDAPADYVDPARRGALRSEIIPGLGPSDESLSGRPSAGATGIPNQYTESGGLLPNLQRTNALRAARGLPPLTEAPLKWTTGTPTEPSVPLPQSITELQAKIAREGLTPENRATIDDALGQLFKNDVPSYEQPPAPVQPASPGERIGQAIIDRHTNPETAITPEIAKIEAIQHSGDYQAGFSNEPLFNADAGYRQPIEWDPITGRPTKWLTAQNTIEGLSTRTDEATPRITPAEAAELQMGGRVGESQNIPTPGGPVPNPSSVGMGNAPAQPPLLSSGAALEGAEYPVGPQPVPSTTAPSFGRNTTPVEPAPSSVGMANAPQRPSLIEPTLLESPLAGNAGPAPDLARVTAQDEAFRGRRMEIGSGGEGAPPSGPPTGENLSFGGMEPPKPPAPTFGQRLKDILSLPMTMKSAVDVSAPGRQLAPMLYAHPTAIDDVLKAQFRALRSPEAFEASQEALRTSPNRVYREIAGVDLGGITSGREEQVASTLADKVPGVAASNRAYTAAINEGRNWLFDQLFSKMDPADLTEAGLRNGGIEQLKKIGSLVNASTGRGDIAKVLTENQVLGQPLLWAPKLLAGRIQLPASMLSSNPIVRQEAMRQVVSFVGANTALLSMMKATGAADVELDPRSSDFGQIRIGNRRFDPWAGYRPIVNLVARASVSAKNAVTGSTTPNEKSINTPAGAGSLYSKDGLQVIADFLRAKMAPIPGEVLNQITGQDITGEDVKQPIADKGGAVAGRLEHAVSGLLAPLNAESLAQELGYTVPMGNRQGGIGGALAEAGKSVAANIPYVSGVGGGYYVPSPQDRAKQGEYRLLAPDEQLQALTAQSWTALKGHPQLPQNLQDVVKQYGSHYEWETALREHYITQLEQQGYSPSNAMTLADRAVQKHPLQQAYADVRNGYEAQWIRANPKLAEKVLQEDAGKDPTQRRLSPNNADRNVIQQAVGAGR